MKRYILIALTWWLALAAYSQTSTAPLNMGSFSSSFSYVKTLDTNASTHSMGNSTKDVWLQFTLTQPMRVTISHCGSAVQDTQMFFLDASRNILASNGTSYRTGCSNSLQGYLDTEVFMYRNVPPGTLSPGTYYVVSEGESQNGNITIDIQGTLAFTQYDLGGKNAPFTYTHTQDLTTGTNGHPYAYYSDYPYYGYYPYNDVFYKFKLEKEMSIRITHEGSILKDTYLGLLNEDKTDLKYSIGNNDNYAVLECANLSAGTYFVVCEGTMGTGVITTNIRAILPYDGLAAGTNQNYIRTFAPLVGSSEVSCLTAGECLQSVQYFDGLGRPMETVQRGITQAKNDLVTYQEYDAYGRESNAWLPVPKTSNQGAFVPLSSLTGLSSTTYADAKGYATPLYEASPLNRVVEQYGPGADWHTKKRSVKTAYMTNVAGVDTLNCVRYTATDHATVDTVMTINRVGNYGSGQLYVTRMTDEDGATSFEFKDKKGQIVLTRQIIRTGTQKNLHDTYYMYDNFGNLKAVLPPLAADAMITGTSWVSNDKTNPVLRNFAYLYHHDHRNRCVMKKLPGAECIRFIYDKADRLIFSQDGEQRVKQIWAFSIPDTLGRVVLTGTCKTVNSKAITNADFKNNLVVAVYSSTGTHNRYTVKKDATTLTIGKPVYLTTNYYDNYDFMTQTDFSGLTYSLPTGADAAFNTRDTTNPDATKALLTGTLVGDAAGGTAKEYSVLYYDSRGRMIQSRSSNFLGGKETECFVYKFTGQTEKRLSIHKRLSTSAETKELYDYKYDHAGRMLTTTHQLNGGTVVTLANNTYDELGRLKSHQKHNHVNLKTTYEYNIRSWTKSIASNLFTETLYYNDAYAGNKACYNGNISAMSWKIENETLRGYRFAYDALSRLTKADYLVNGVTNDNYKLPTLLYDKHGNIKALERWGKTTTGATYGRVDSLTIYYNGNQLTRVNDSGTNVTIPESGDFKNATNVAIEYTYNKNGAMTKDLNKGITGISYNSLNLPLLLSFSNTKATGSNTYTYLADGRKVKVIQKLTSPSASTLTTEYIGNKVYENGVLKRTLIEGGYIEGTAYFFYLTDHLGNNRVVANTSGVAVQKNHYDPFGVSFAEVANAEQDKQAYKYNGKELDRVGGLNLYDYGARHYEAALGRFTTMDPLSEKYYSVSPYAYCLNNPLRFVDPTGMYVGDPLLPRFQRSQYGDNALVNVGKFVHNTATAITNAPIDVVNGLASEANYIYNNGVGAYLQGAASTVSNAVSGEVNYRTNTSMSQQAADMWSSMQNPVAWENAVAGAVLALTPMKMSGAGAKTASGMVGAEVAQGVNAAKAGKNVFKAVDDVIANPSLLNGKSLSEVQGVLKNSNGWVEGSLKQGRSTGQGWTFRQLNNKGTDFTDLYIQYSPGSPRHFGGEPYWKVSSGYGGTQWFPAGK